MSNADIEALRPKAGRFDEKKVLGMFTKREMKKLRAAIHRKDGKAVRTFIMVAIQRSGQPLAYFMTPRREKIIVS